MMRNGSIVAMQTIKDRRRYIGWGLSRLTLVFGLYSMGHRLWDRSRLCPMSQLNYPAE